MLEDRSEEPGESGGADRSDQTHTAGGADGARAAARLPVPFVRWHAWARAQPALRRFTLANRLLLAMAFLPTGLTKALGRRFTTIPDTDPIGYFFEAMYQTGAFWHFIGVTQICAAVLLLIPATSTFGALLFLPIGVSIFLITWGLHFTGTVYIAFGMLLSVTYLLCWDADRLWVAGTSVLGPPSASATSLLEDATGVEKSGWFLGGAAGIVLLLIARGLAPSMWTGAALVLGVAAVGLVFAGWVLGFARDRRDAA